jgi:gluconolactonase
MNLQKTARLIGLYTLILMTVSRAADLPPASIGPALDTDTNPPMIAKNASGVLGTIQRLDPAVDKLLPTDAKVEILVEGVDWAEGPIWFHEGLNFSDVKQNTMYRWTPEKGVGIYLKPSGYTGATPRGGEPGSNGLTLDRQGRLVMCQHGDRRVCRLENDGKTLTVLADKFDGKRLNSPNDLCFDSKGNLYFTDPPYGLEQRDADPKKELENSAYLVRPGGEIVRLNLNTIDYGGGKSGPVRYPNGVALSVDEKSLYFCISDPDHPVYLKYDIQPGGNIANGKIFFDTSPMLAKGLKGLPDGIKMDLNGNVWATGPGGVFIFNSEGKHLGTLLTGVKTANLNWGDDGSTLYICAEHNVCRIKTLVKGVMAGHAMPRQ